MPIFIAAAMMAVRQPWIGATLFAWISVMNPHRLTFGFAYSLPLAAAAAAVTMLGIMFGKQRFRFPIAAPTVMLILFMMWMAMTTAFAIHSDSSLELYIRALKTLVMALVMTAVIQDRKHIHVFLWTLVLSLGFYGVKGGLFTIVTGGGARVWGPPDSLVNGNNELAVALVMIVPLMYYLSTTFNNKWHRRLMYAMIFFSTVAALGTQSRGALLAVIAMSGMLWIKSSQKWRLMAAALLLALVIFGFMPDSWWERMATIGTYKEDGSAMGRVNAWEMAVNIAFDRITGAGFDAWTPLTYELYSPNKERAPLVAHSIYFHVLGDHGFIGLAIFLTFWLVTYRCANDIRKDTESIQELHWARDLSRMFQVGLVGYFVGGAFLSLAYWDVPYFIMVLIVTLKRYVSEKLPQFRQISESGADLPGPRQRIVGK